MNGKLTWPSEEREREAQQKKNQAEADVEARNWEKKTSDFACQEINQECESPRFQLLQASRRADQDCQEIEELRIICCEQTDQARKQDLKLSMQQQRNPTTESEVMAQTRKLQNKVNSLSDAREFYDPESGSSSGATHVPD